MKKNTVIIITFFLSILSLIFNTGGADAPAHIIMRILDILILIILCREIIAGLSGAEYRRQWLRRNIPLICFTGIYLIALICIFALDLSSYNTAYFNLVMIVVRSLFILYRGFENIKTLEHAVRRLNERPAISIIRSFFTVIMIGTLLLMLPFSTVGTENLSFINSWFTATSAVCVTGLIVVDTATAFSIAGKIIILALIQTGGLGIMIITYMSMFILGRRITLEDKKRLSMVISDTDMADIVGTLRKIVGLTFAVEGAGAVVLFMGFGLENGFSPETFFSAVFHSVSAFCNAGFSLFSDSLEGFSSNPLVIFTISTLIILGGLSFAVIFNVRDYLNPRSRIRKLNLNTKVVLLWTAVLLLSGFFIFYAVEHGNTLRGYGTPQQYLASFFQSVTLRTAGFNSVSFSGLRTGTLMIMCVYMFIGAASGSTAGGIKVNTAAVLLAYLKSVITNSPSITLYRHQLSETRVLRAFVVFGYGIAAVFLGTILLSLSCSAPLENIIFEAVSAFGTVGLSTGITPQLNSFGKIIIIFLMFNGRLGPLTILSTYAGRTEKSGIRYPGGDILIG